MFSLLLHYLRHDLEMIDDFRHSRCGPCRALCRTPLRCGTDVAAERDRPALNGDANVVGFTRGMPLERRTDLLGNIGWRHARFDLQPIDQARHTTQRSHRMRCLLALVGPVHLTRERHPAVFDQHLDAVGRQGNLPFKRGAGRLGNVCVRMRSRQADFDFLHDTTHASNTFGCMLGSKLSM